MVQMDRSTSPGYFGLPAGSGGFPVVFLKAGSRPRKEVMV